MSDTAKRIISTTSLRLKMSEALGFKPDDQIPDGSPNHTRQSIAFLKKADWSNPHVVDTAMKTYICHVVEMLNKRPKGCILPKPVNVSWGSPSTDENDRLVRPALRVMVINPGEPNEAYVLSFTPSVKEEEMQPHTKEFLNALQSVISQDLGLQVGASTHHPLMDEPEIALPGQKPGEKKFAPMKGRNMYDGEGVIWDISLPSKETALRLREIVTGEREVSSLHR